MSGTYVTDELLIRVSAVRFHHEISVLHVELRSPVVFSCEEFGDSLPLYIMHGGFVEPLGRTLRESSLPLDLNRNLFFRFDN